MTFKEVTTTEIKFMNKEEYYAWYNVVDMLGDLIAFESSNGRPESELCLNAEMALNAMTVIEDKYFPMVESEEDDFEDEDDYDEACANDHALDLLRNDLDMVDEEEDEEEQTVYKVYLLDESNLPVKDYEYLGKSTDFDEACEIGLDCVRSKGWNVEYERYLNDINGKGTNIDYGSWDNFIWITPAPPESWWHSWDGKEEEND